MDKENGGKSDALNTGACAARYPLVCCLDADIILEEDALLRVARPMIESSKVAAVGGIVRVANGSEFEKGRMVNIKTPRKLLPNFQIVEYLRAFIAVRTAWSKLNCLLIISGAIGMFRRRDLISAGGYAHDTVGEDMELTTRIHRALRENHRRYRVTFVPDPVAWTEVPDTLKVLGRQRDRWHRGLIDTLFRHRKMLFNPRYGTVGLLGMPYFFLFEFIGPVVEILGYAAFITGLLLGVLDLEFVIAFFLAAIGLGALLSTAAVFLEELRLERYPRWRDLLKLTAYSVLENFGYRQVNTLWRAMAIVSFPRKNQSWGAMEGKGFAGEKTSIPEARRQITEPERGDDTTMRRYLRPRRQAPEADVEEQPATAAPTQDSPQETPAPTETEQPEGRVEEGVQLGGDAQVEEDERLEGAVTVTSEYIVRLERESEDANALIRDLGGFVERVDVLRDRLKEDARRIGELRERLEQGIAEVNALRSQIEEDTSRVDELIR